jgi:small subunit ribosomal protein S17
MLTKKGTITSAGKMQNTVTVTVHQSVRHPLYKKSFRKSKKFLADTNGMTDLMAGDEVEIEECRPLSKNKHFKIKEVLKRTPRVSEMAEEAAIEKTIHREKTASTSDSSQK